MAKLRKYKGIDDTKKEQRREEKRQLRHEKRELKRILLGRSHRNPDGRLEAADGPVAINRNGMEDGAVAIYFLGIMKRRKHYRTQLREKDFVKKADAAMANIGNRVALAQTPDFPAVFRRYRLSVPALLFLEKGEDEIIVNTVSARSLTGFRSTRTIRQAFEKEMGEALTAVKRIKESDESSSRKGKR